MPAHNGAGPVEVLVLSPHLAPPPGGVQRFAMDVADSLGHREVRIVGVSEADSADPRVRVVRQRPGRLGPVLTNVAYALAVMDEVRRRPHTVQAMTWRAALPALLVPRRPPVALFCMGGELLRARGGRLEVAVRRAVLRRVDALVAISNYTAGLVREACGREPRLIHPPVRTVPANVTRRAPADDIAVLSVGRLVKNKGHDRLLRAVAAARAAGAPLTLTIASSGPEDAALRALSRELGLEAAVRFAGAVSDEELDALYRSSDIFALLSVPVAGEVEGFGIVFLEANAHELPVVAGRSGGSVDAVDDGVTGIVVESVEEAAEALVALASDPARRRALGAAGRARLPQFSLEHLGEQLTSLHDELIA